MMKISKSEQFCSLTYTIHKPERQWTNNDNNNANRGILRMESGDSSHNITNFRNNGCLDYV